MDPYWSVVAHAIAIADAFETRQISYSKAHSSVASLIPASFISALIHDSNGTPIDATNRRRHPTRRQRRLVKERDKTCVDCGPNQLLEYDHVPAYEDTRHTITKELQLRCAPCHHTATRS